MEAHPVPQNVTSFEFHLVGDMTLKQFGYLATGVGIAYLIFLIFGTKFPVLAYPAVAFFALMGVAFAFLPINERPLDHWVKAFFRAIFLPTQRSWEAQTIKKTDPAFSQRLNLTLSRVTPAFSVQENPKLGAISQLAPNVVPMVSMAPSLLPQTPPTPPPPTVKEKEVLPTNQELHQTVELAKKATEVQAQIVSTENEMEAIRREAAAPGVDPKAFTDQFQKVMTKLEELSQTESQITQAITGLSQPALKVTPKVVVPTIKRSVPVNLTLTTTPNVINGIVTDTDNNYIEGVIVVTHDRQGLPVRALKTNKLGQFVAATPLPNGNYTISLEKDNLSFGNVEVSLDGKILPPIAIAAQRS